MKLKKNFQPNSASTKKILKDKMKGFLVGPSLVQNTVSEEVGDLENAEAISDFHTDCNQIKYVRNIYSRLTLTCTFRNSRNLSQPCRFILTSLDIKRGIAAI